MTNKKDNVLFYALIGVGYLLFCTSIPSLAAGSLATVMGGDVNLYYAVLSLVTGIMYVTILFKKMYEPMDLFSGISVGGVVEAAGVAVVLFLVINFVVSPALVLLFPGSAENYGSSVTDMMQTPVATFLQVAVIAPLWEELIFRGFILKRALRQWSSVVAVLMTAVLFGVLHMSIVQGISAAAAGIVLCAFYVRRKSVGLNILAHSVYNGMVFVMAVCLA